jgi:hypothetical protein
MIDAKIIQLENPDGIEYALQYHNSAVEGSLSTTITFESLNALVAYYQNAQAEHKTFRLTEGREFIVGYELGALAVELVENDLSQEKIVEGIAFSTDGAWQNALIELAAIIRHAADHVE